MFKKILKTAEIAAIILLPNLAMAAGELAKTKTFFQQVQDVINVLIPVAFALAILFFFWGIAKYIWSAGSAKDEGKQIMYWGVAAIFVMTMIWGIVRFLAGILDVEQNAAAPKVPTINK